MSSELVIRPYLEGDFDAVAALWRDRGLTVPSNDPADDIARCMASPQATLFVGTIDDAVIATAMVGSDGHRGWIYYLAVAEPLARSGIGGRMVLHAEEWLASLGVPKVQLMIRAENEAVRGFYDRLGYDEVPRLVMERWLVEVPGKTRRPR